MKIFALGDIHGCLDELVEILEIVDKRFKPGDKIVFIGDYIDRGPHSKQVVQLVIDRLAERPDDHVALLGNHEDMFMEIVDLNQWGSTLYAYQQMHKQTIDSYLGDDANVKLDQLRDSIPPSHIEFFKTLRLAYQYERFVFAHAGIDPTLMMDQQSEQTLLWDRNHVGYSGNYVGGYFVTYGHTPKDRPVIRANQLGIDTACVFGGILTCAEIDTTPGATDLFILHQVAAKKKHY